VVQGCRGSYYAQAYRYCCLTVPVVSRIVRLWLKIRMFFKSKVTVDDFALLLLQEHAAIFGEKGLTSICQECQFRFRDETCYTDALWALFLFGVYSIQTCVRTHCPRSLHQPILASVSKQIFSHMEAQGAGAQRLSVIESQMLESVKEYEDFGTGHQ
jgi:hypothetical protein